jgi:peroxiredoxin
MLHGKFADEVAILVIDASNRQELTQKVSDEASLTLPVLLDDEDISGEAYSVFATPTTFIVDTTGRIIFKHIGYGPGQENMLEKEIQLLLDRSTT